MTNSLIRRRPVSLVAAALLVVGLVAGLVAPAGAATPSPATGPAAAWLAGLVGPGGSVENPYDPGTPSVGWTVNVALSLAAAGGQDATLDRAVAYVATRVDDYVTGTNGDLPGRLGYLILLLEATGGNPRSFGGADLVARLEATLDAAEPGLYGVPDPYTAVTDQSLAVLALVAVGRPVPATAVEWLLGQQCVGAGTPATALGAWYSYRADTGSGLPACPAPDAGSFSGADTNATAYAVMALAAVDQLGAASDPFAFLRSGQVGTGPHKGGFAFYPGTCGGDPTAASCPDPNSTAVVQMALIAAGQDLGAWTAGGATPLASLESWVIASGPDAGALASPFSDGYADQYATYQGVWGLSLQTFPLVEPSPVPTPTTTTQPPSPTTTDGSAPAGAGGPSAAAPVVVTPAFTG